MPFYSSHPNFLPVKFSNGYGLEQIAQDVTEYNLKYVHVVYNSNKKSLDVVSSSQTCK